MDEYCNINGLLQEPYSCTLNQTDIDANKNKFYIMQMLQVKDTYVIYIRYGRIGEKGTILTSEYSSKESAVEFFVKQFKSKTSNSFGAQFVKKNGKYFLAEMEKPVIDKSTLSKADGSSVEKNLDDDMDDRVKYFIELISNEKMLSDTLVKLNVDPKKMPLGKISNEQLNKAEELLKKIKLIMLKHKIEDKNTSEITYVVPKEELGEIKQYSCEYYTLVPYSCGRKKPPILEDMEIVDDNVTLIEELKNVHVTYTIIKNTTSLNKLTNVYSQLNSTISPLDKSSQMYTELLKYVANSHGSTHHFKLQVMDIYQVNKLSDDIYENYTKNMNNKMLLFHGSPIANWCSIIKNGLLLDPSKLGVKITGKMFGYGIYWANSITKSFQYCISSFSHNSAVSSGKVAVLAIGEVALGDPLDLYHADFNMSYDKLSKIKKQSTWAKGASAPESDTVIDNVIIPNGKLKKRSIDKSYSLLYDEFIIYNANQYKIKYLIVVKDTS
ncbi:putative poly ADP-ribosyl transferase [Bodo saltans virus]|jgi:poly [ADP-ribose] polymerase|uniref:NAD(+) ADP-ribosyltransferase n=1 Tax=Bodo saltans virus TaxID=2024608 RepID=A0A2H4UTL3_9VIRU|nr:putative poly ADP-ribosyl transferase [Bodo saltans virus]ATZ80272.1 putative poly ADP-ribosyl transferase [Bodo saltans virus]